ncbi:hypothetical protein WK11_16565 [Burkholderia ubonensis]|uniref:hypothetical protein n=1 Tax=Burkholderia ubonensis TaxID=101571 RepID=UPI00075A23AF|nr:hypothetical protein [Burkholderia ubonensis]KVO23972.1 hypothetical protein WJ72_31145 [Burkholderia ubonensis]KVQ72676.1 hypothetical protein WK05_13060 [Burkholderia ubonensis]KVR03633.1 hypothetical protein WK11_16565 [Burkholderia ubonensis]
MRELNHRDIGLVSGGATIVGGVTGSVFIGADATGAGAAGGNAVSIVNGVITNSKRIEFNYNGSISIAYVPINSDWASNISSFRAVWFRKFPKYF